ncbi:hypothetical protein ACOMHN_001820 [Nucella lapillus]
MKKLSETWRQRKPQTGRGTEEPRDFTGTFPASSTTKTISSTNTSNRLEAGRAAVQVQPMSINRTTVKSGSSNSEATLEGVSSAAKSLEKSRFCVTDFDTDVLKAVQTSEKATHHTNIGTDEDGSSKHPLPTTTPFRQKHMLESDCSKPGKRKNATRRSTCRKPSLFGNDSALSESLTPTRSPRLKRRKDDDNAVSNMPSKPKNGQLLCPASPSPELHSDSHHPFYWFEAKLQEHTSRGADCFHDNWVSISVTSSSYSELKICLSFTLSVKESDSYNWCIVQSIGSKVFFIRACNGRKSKHRRLFET